MIESARELTDRLRDWAIEATTVGHLKRCSIELRVTSDGLLISGTSWDSKHRAARVVPWDEVTGVNGAVTAALENIAARAARAARDQ